MKNQTKNIKQDGEIRVRFYKEDDLWYADIPEHTKRENLMVYGSDDFLQFIYKTLKFNNNELTLFVSSEKITDSYLFSLTRYSHNGAGANYIIGGAFANKYKIDGSRCWLCNVTHTVFGEHPKHIYVNCIKK